MFEEEFSVRLAQLRNAKDVSAREMSLALGQNAGYINNIENGKALPSMSNFFYICQYLDITPCEFFDTDNRQPQKLDVLMRDLKKLDDKQLETITALIQGLLKK
ncbi:MAG: helix-turn-helix transcriptional regulator [Clostridiales bacterium]|nr:helix-turn-helix transcriptional regulator [Clostridiales bacterium]